MKKTISTLFLSAVAFLNSANLTAQEVAINASESSIHWTGKKVTGQHEGNINLISGSLNMTDGVLTGGSFVVDMNSITTTDLEGGSADKLEGHLKSDDFFGVQAHPKATLIFSTIESKGAGLYSITGDFTIKGKTNPETFELQLSEGSATAKVVIDRSKYYIRYGSKSFFENIGDKLIYDEFDLDVTLKL
jgi:polyisoprenoid-binding protein YceI